MGFFGILSIGFLTAAAVAILGYLTYTAALTRERTPQYGALRANGLSAWQLLGILLLEQTITLGVAVGLGVALARTAVKVFLPFLQHSSADLSPVPPFVIVTSGVDAVRLTALIAALLIVTVTAVVGHILRTRLAAAIKMGDLQ